MNKKINHILLHDVLSEISDETNNIIEFRPFIFSKPRLTKSSQIRSIGLIFEYPISTTYEDLIKLSLRYYYQETSDDICCHIEYSSKKDKINSIRFFINNNKEIYSFNEKDFQQIMTRFGKYKYSTFLRMSEINYKSKQF